MLRPAVPEDLGALYALENICFGGDRFSRRQLSHLLLRANAYICVLYDESDQLMGYGMLLFRRTSQMARLYSFCVHPDVRGGGNGRVLLNALEEQAIAKGCTRMQLEVRADNRSAIALYRRLGYRVLYWLDDYYSDGCAGWKMAKPLVTEAAEASADAPAEISS
ncbi:GNAT family N-acetyltransferase [Phytohalomonas tamaricis]|uniref:GNAT family N-acetyltransferase n=1 Tax=Phytohalomonas tamaricis TaxID=2081032 RepID=UPI002948BB73|nr:N-acetyltransferase [Phytohalomonas tamaricis]